MLTLNLSLTCKHDDRSFLKPFVHVAAYSTQPAACSTRSHVITRAALCTSGHSVLQRVRCCVAIPGWHSATSDSEQREGEQNADEDEEGEGEENHYVDELKTRRMKVRTV